MKSSQTPEAPSGRIGWYRPSQWLKLPTTETREAAGAQTAKETPATPPRSRAVGAELFVDPVLVALVEEVQVLVAERGQEAVRIEELPDLPAGIGGPQLIFEDLGPLGDRHFEEPLGGQPRHRRHAAPGGVRLDHLAADAPRRKARTTTPCRRVHAEHRMGIGVTGLQERLEVGFGDEHRREEGPKTGGNELKIAARGNKAQSADAKVGGEKTSSGSPRCWRGPAAFAAPAASPCSSDRR